jgi:hypothetical protein
MKEEKKAMSYEIKPTPAQRQEADRRAAAEKQTISVVRTRRGTFVCSADELMSKHALESVEAIYTARPPAEQSNDGQASSGSTTGSDQQSQEQQAALYGPEGRADHTQGDTITFANRDTGGQPLTGKILYVRAPGPAIVGGRSHPTTYITFVEGEAFPRMVYPGDVIER